MIGNPLDPRVAAYYEAAIFNATRRWQSIIPKRALRVEHDDVMKCVRYLHPTKGWRIVSYRRLGISGAV